MSKPTKKLTTLFAGFGFVVGGVFMMLHAWPNASDDARLIAGSLSIIAGLISDQG